MTPLEAVKKFWQFLRKDTWQSWLVSLILIVVIIRFIFFPVLGAITGTPLPLVVVESCSMYHGTNFDSWWDQNAAWYESKGITKTDFQSYSMKNGLNKGDIIFVWGKGEVEKGDIIIFLGGLKYPIIHRIVTDNPIGTKGDNGRTNADQLNLEKNIPENAIIGKAVGKVPFLGWVKLIFFEGKRSPEQRGFCK